MMRSDSSMRSDILNMNLNLYSNLSNSALLERPRQTSRPTHPLFNAYSLTRRRTDGFKECLSIFGNR